MRSTTPDGTIFVVSASDCHLCRIELEMKLPSLSVDDLFKLFNNPFNADCFRDINDIPHRALMLDLGVGSGGEIVEVIQRSTVKFLMFHKHFDTLFHCQSDPGAKSPFMKFFLARPGMLQRFHGEWVVESVESGGCVARLTQDVLPAGISPSMARAPFIGKLLIGLSLRAVRRIVEDIRAFENKVKNGENIEDILNPHKKTAIPLKGPSSVLVKDCVIPLDQYSPQQLDEAQTKAYEATGSHMDPEGRENE